MRRRPQTIAFLQAETAACNNDAHADWRGPLKVRAAAAAVLALAVLPIAGGCADEGGSGEAEAPSPSPNISLHEIPGAPSSSSNVTLVTTNSFAISDAALAEFADQTGYTLTVLPVGSAGVLANQLALTADAPLGDAFFGVDNTFASRLLENNVADPFTPTGLPASAGPLVLGGGALTPVTRGDVCVNIDDAWFAAEGVEAPTGFADLVAPEYRGLTVALNPATSSPGMAFLLATIAAFPNGATGGVVGGGTAGSWQAYWELLFANDVFVADSWSTGYFSEFSGAGEGGERPIVVSYASSPASTLAEGPDGEMVTTTSALLNTCFGQVEYAGVLRSAANPAGARALVEFLVSPSFQAELPTQMWVFPIGDGAALPDDWARFAPLPPAPLTLDAADIEANRDAWLEEWLQIAAR